MACGIDSGSFESIGDVEKFRNAHLYAMRKTPDRSQLLRGASSHMSVLKKCRLCRRNADYVCKSYCLHIGSFAVVIHVKYCSLDAFIVNWMAGF